MFTKLLGTYIHTSLKSYTTQIREDNKRAEKNMN